MPAAPGAFVGAAAEVRAAAVPMRSAAALPMALRSAARINAAAFIVPALRKRGCAAQAGRKQEQQGSLEHRALQHHFSTIATRLGISHCRDMEKSDYASRRDESLI
jgi:hypothetical protein